MKTTITFSILIWINSSRAKDNEAEIFARVTVNQRRVNISLKKKVNIDSWDKAKSRVRGTGQEARIINIYIEQSQAALFQAYQDLTYGLERVKLNQSIGLDDSETEVDPQNPNPRRAHGSDEERDPLELIIQSFNERWFQGWDATPEDQRVITKSIQAHPDFKTKVAENKDQQNKNLAFKKILDEVMSKQRKNELDLYRLYAKDDAFYQAFFDTMKRMAQL